MRRLKLWSLCAAVIVAGCAKDIVEVPDSGQKGEVMISLSSEAGETPVRPSLKSEEQGLPDVSEFEVEIYNSGKIRLYRDTYANSEGKKILLNAGGYRLLAQYGDSARIGFNSPWFAADTNFTVEGQKLSSLKAVAKMRKVKATVNLGPNIRAQLAEGVYSDCYSVIRRSKTQSLEFSKDETRAGYFPAGELAYEFYAVKDGKLMYYPAAPKAYAGNESVTFNVDIILGEGKLGVVTVTVDETVDEIVKETQIPEDYLPKDAPSVSLSGFGETSSLSFVEMMPLSGVQADIKSPGGIARCELVSDSQYLAGKGVPEVVDLAAADMDKNVEETLKSLGFRWVRDMAGNRLANVDFTRLPLCNVYDPSGSFDGTFRIRVTDASGKTGESEEFSISQKPAVISLRASDANAFARRFVGLSALTELGNPEAVTVQYSLDGTAWTDVPKGAVQDNVTSFPDVTGLAPATEYHVRAVYNGNEHNVTEAVILTTEQELQVGNAGFEEWQTLGFGFKPDLKGEKNRDWYLPYNAEEDDTWWAVNSKKTMRSSCAGDAFGIGANYNFKVFPTVTFYTEGEGRCAQLAAVTTGRAATNTGPGTDDVRQIAGEMWIGTATDGGDHATDGHTFASRPSGMSFRCQYSSYNNESFHVYVELKDVEGKVIASKEMTNTSSFENWETITLPFEYADKTKKATSIYISFKSSTSSSPQWRKTTITMPGGNEEALIGSVLKIDDIQLIYE